MARQVLTPIIFAVLALLFAWLAWRDKEQQEGVVSPARKTRMRIALIFAVVSLVLFLL